MGAEGAKCELFAAPKAPRKFFIFFGKIVEEICNKNSKIGLKMRISGGIGMSVNSSFKLKKNGKVNMPFTPVLRPFPFHWPSRINNLLGEGGQKIEGFNDQF